MKRKQSLLLIALLVSIQITGCGADHHMESTEYQQIEGLDAAVSGSLSLEELQTETEAVPESETPEATGDETTEQRIVSKNVSVFSEPSEESSVVGTVKAANRVQVIESQDDGKWCKIVYKGRVAYILASALAEETEEEEPVHTPADTPTDTPAREPADTPASTPTNEPTVAPEGEPSEPPEIEQPQEPEMAPEGEVDPDV